MKKQDVFEVNLDSTGDGHLYPTFSNGNIYHKTSGKSLNDMNVDGWYLVTTFVLVSDRDLLKRTFAVFEKVEP